MTDQPPPLTGPTVTDREIALETADRSAVLAGEGRGGATRVRTRASFAASVKRTWSVLIGDAPSLWSEAPATPAELVRYALKGEWCSSTSVVWRTLGRAYSGLVAIPGSVLLYLAAWVLQRPGRLLALIVLITLVSIFA